MFDVFFHLAWWTGLLATTLTHVTSLHPLKVYTISTNPLLPSGLEQTSLSEKIYHRLYFKSGGAFSTDALMDYRLEGSS